MIHQIILANDELELLRLNVNQAKQYAEVHVVEADHTFSGTRKPFHIKDSGLFDDVHLMGIEGNVSIDPWVNEEYQRNYWYNLERETLGPGDVIIVSDADEILSSPGYYYVKNPTFSIVTFNTSAFYYNAHNIVVDLPTRAVICAATVGYMKSKNLLPDTLRWSRLTRTLFPAGWHYSFMGGPEVIAKKLTMFSHQEYNRPPFTDPGYILECIQQSKDIFQRPGFEVKFSPFDKRFHLESVAGCELLTRDYR